jgi:beta-galactosidase
MCEYAHAMGNSVGNFTDYWELIDSYPSLQGGFIWDWVDQGIRLPVPGSNDETFFGFGGDVGPAAPEAEGFTGIYGNNFCMNGLLRADQAPNPGIAVLKHVMQPVLVEAVDLAAGRVRVTNRYDHIDWSEKLVGRYVYTVDGTTIDEGELELPSLQPAQSAEIEVPVVELAIEPGAEPRLQLSFRLADDELWADAGHEVAWADFLMPSAVPGPPIDPSQAPSLNVVDGESSVEVRGAGFAVRIDKASGALVSFELDSEELLTEPLRPHFWRAMTDNDLGNFLRSNSGRWEEVGDELEATSIVVDSSDEKETVITAELRADGLFAELTLEYRVFASGEVGVELDFRPSDSLPEMPRFGMRLALDDALERLQWMGPGPQPSYSDRLLLPVGLYEGLVAEQFVPYARAQESGNKADARFIALRDSTGRGLLAVGAPLLSANALPFSTEAVDAARHPHELEADGKTHLNLDRAQRGVGGDNSWGRAPLREYRIPADAQSYRYWLRGLRPGDVPSALARRQLP